jgi:SAM-dependent methyltransferase
MTESERATKIWYGLSGEAWLGVQQRLADLIRTRNYRRVIELGAGANPTFALDFVTHHGLDYTLLDISQEELDKAPPGYRTLCADICTEHLEIADTYDFAFSRMLAEHVPSGHRFHHNVYRLLRAGGAAFHFFPTLYAPPFLANYLLPEQLSEWLLHLFQSGRERSGKFAKFPAMYSWCRGPLASQIRSFESLGFAVEEYAGFFGHEPYYRRVPLVGACHRWLSYQLSQHPIPWLTSFAQVLLVKK